MIPTSPYTIGRPQIVTNRDDYLLIVFSTDQLDEKLSVFKANEDDLDRWVSQFPSHLPPPSNDNSQLIETLFSPIKD